MHRGPLQPVLHFLHTLALRPLLQQQSDAKLIERFRASGDEAAFTVLVQRHGPMVLGVCQRIVHSAHEAEDCFQAVFLTLAQKAPSIRKPEHLAGWLHGVARRIAGKARARLLRRKQREQPLVDVAVTREDDVLWRDLRPLLDEEIAALPPPYRAAFVLCHLQGKTHAEAARQLGWPRATVATRLGWARQRLQRRLLRRGVTLPAGALATLLATRAAPAVLPAGLAGTTVRAVLLVGAGKTAAGGVLAATIIQGVLRAMTLSKRQLAGLLLAVGVLGAGAGWLGGTLADRSRVGRPPSSQPEERVLEELTALRKDVQEMRTASTATKPEAQTPGSPPDAEGPLYQGKPASYWLGQFRDRDPEYRRNAVPALVQLAVVDRSLIPVLLDGLQDEDVAGIIAQVLPRCRPPVDKAVVALLRSRASVQSILPALKKIDREGKVAIPAALDALKDTDPRVRRHGAMVPLGYGKSKARRAIAALVEALKIGDEQLPPDAGGQFLPACVVAVRLLGKIGPEAHEAIPALVEMVQAGPASLLEPRGLGDALLNELQQDIARAIAWIDPEGTRSVPALIRALEKTKDHDFDSAGRILWMLGELGSKAKPAVPVLLSIQKANKKVPRINPLNGEKIESSLGPAAAEALEKIDPEATKKATAKDKVTPKSPR